MKPDLKIKEPIWKTESIGINIDYFMTRAKLLISIEYKDSLGLKVFPDLYWITREEAREYPTQVITRKGKDITLVIIPIKDLHVFTSETRFEVKRDPEDYKKAHEEMKEKEEE